MTTDACEALRGPPGELRQPDVDLRESADDRDRLAGDLHRSPGDLSRSPGDLHVVLDGATHGARAGLPPGRRLQLVRRRLRRPAARLRLPLVRGDERGRPGLLVQVALITIFLIAYDALRNLAPGRTSVALSNAHRVLHAERAAGISPEHALNTWLNGHHGLALAAATFYDSAHYFVTIPLLIAVYVRFPGSYRRLRDVLVVTNAVGLLGFWLFPLAPPRMLAGFHDTVALTHALGGWSTTISSNADEYAAMPSLHVGWALWVLLATVMVTRGSRHRRPLVAVASAHVLVTVLVILATGNHYLLDAVAGALCLASAALLVRGARLLLGRWRDRRLAAPSAAVSPLDKAFPVAAHARP